MDEHLQIFFKRTGGLSGSVISGEIDSRELKFVEAEELKFLVDRSGFFEVLVLHTTFLQMPDQFQYVLSIEHMGKNRTLKLTDGNLPDQMRPLIDHLVHLVRVARKS